MRTYQKEVDRQRKLVLKAEYAQQRLLLVVQGLKTLFAKDDETYTYNHRINRLSTI